MIPASPAVMAPPVKKQRAGNTPEDPIAARTQNAINYRSERLQDLAQRYGTVTRAQQPQNAVLNGYGPSSTSVVPPQSRRRGESIRSDGRVPPTGMNGIVAGTSNTRGPTPEDSNVRLNAGGSSSFESQQTVIPSQKLIPPPKPGMATMQPRRSDIFPTVTKQSPISSKPSSSFVSASAIKSSQPSTQSGDVAVARRLDESFQANSTNQIRSKSAPPTRPPPPPGPPPITKEEATKSVTFQVPQASTIVSPPNRVPLTGKSPENTATPDDTTTSNRDAGATPFYTSVPPSATPFRSNATDDLPTPQTTTRRDLLRNMREFAESPDKPMTSPTGSVGSVKSPELRLHEQLASTEKEKAAALRKVAQLEDEISQMKDSSINSNHRNVGFMSPVTNMVPSPIEKKTRRIGTPHPKSKMPKPLTPTEIDEERRCLLDAAKKAPFEYDAEDGITFIVRRPYGLATETDLWYKIGQLPEKLYAKSSNVETFSTIEVAAIIPCDNSIFLLFGEGEVRHQSNITGMSTDYGRVEERLTAIGNVMYVDKNAIDKEYSLDELYEFALSVRGHYCTTVRSFAAALQLHPDPHTTETLPSTTKIANDEMKSKVIDTADKAVATDDLKGNEEVKVTKENSQASKELPTQHDDEATLDVLASFIQLFFSMIFGTIWFIFVTLPTRILTTTIVMALSAIFLSYVWILFIDENGELGSSMRILSNRPGVL